MGVRAKMRCIEVSDRTSITGKAVETKFIRLQPVYGSDENDKANKEWSRWTPSGELQMTVTNPDAFNQFKLGVCYYVDLNEVIE